MARNDVARLESLKPAEVSRSRGVRGRLASAGTSSVGYLFVLPATLALALVLLFPLAYVVYSSFGAVRGQEAGGLRLANYSRLFLDGKVREALANTATFTVASVGLHLGLGLVAALLLNRRFIGRTLFRIVALVPWTFAPVVVGVVWRWMYNAQFGIINDSLIRLGLIPEARSWLGEASLAMPSLILANVWRGFPFVMIVALAGLQAIPRELYEAASVDGADAGQQFWYVTLPNLRYVLLIAVILDSIWTFKHFDLVQVMTGGGPAGATEVLSTLIYRTSFEYLDIPYASAMAVAMFTILFGLMLVYLRMVLGSRE